MVDEVKQKLTEQVCVHYEYMLASSSEARPDTNNATARDVPLQA